MGKIRRSIIYLVNFLILSIMLGQIQQECGCHLATSTNPAFYKKIQ